MKNNKENCPSCHSHNVELLYYQGFFEYETVKYPLQTEYLKCCDCSTEYFGKEQVKKNQEYLWNVKTNGHPILAH